MKTFSKALMDFIFSLGMIGAIKAAFTIFAGIIILAGTALTGVAKFR